MLDIVLCAHLQAWSGEVDEELQQIVLQFENLKQFANVALVSGEGSLSDSGNS